MESVDSKEGMKSSDSRFKQEIHSNVIRAGKRTYFFDVKSTRSNEYYLTITESKKKFSEHGKMQYEKHKIFLYREDFEKFTECLQDIIEYIYNNQPEVTSENESEEVAIENEPGVDYTDVEFEDI